MSNSIPVVILTIIVTIVSSKPIMVSFGTRQGPIVPPAPSTTTLNPLAPKNPAPVYENQDGDLPSPQYKAPTPNEYRNHLIANGQGYKLTPQDAKYHNRPAQSSPESLTDLELRRQKDRLAQSQGLQYTGPQVYNVQPYEVERAQENENERKKGKLTNAQQIVRGYLGPAQRQLLEKEEEESKRFKKDGSSNLYQVQSFQNNRYQNNQLSHDANRIDQVSLGTGSNVAVVHPDGFVRYYYVPRVYFYDNNNRQQHFNVPRHNVENYYQRLH